MVCYEMDNYCMGSNSLNKKISIILVVFITMSIFLIGVISFYNNIFSYSQKQCEQVLTGTIDNIGLLYVENGDFYYRKHRIL